MLKPDHSLAWNNMVILLDNTGTTNTHSYTLCTYKINKRISSKKLVYIKNVCNL